MKAVSAFAVAALLLSGAALAQDYSAGQRVQAMNPTTGKVESATITRIDGGRYLLHSDNAAIEDWDVAVTDLSTNAPVRSSASASTPSSGSLGGLPADGAPVPLSPPPANSAQPDDNAPPAEPR